MFVLLLIKVFFAQSLQFTIFAMKKRINEVTLYDTKLIMLSNMFLTMSDFLYLRVNVCGWWL